MAAESICRRQIWEEALSMAKNDPRTAGEQQEAAARLQVHAVVNTILHLDPMAKHASDSSYFQTSHLHPRGALGTSDYGICSCRDRKKAKHEANEAIVKVSEQLKDAHFLREEGDNLQAANQQMREALRAREAEIARVR